MKNINSSDTQFYFDQIALQHGLNESSNVNKFKNIHTLLLPCSTHPEIVECGGGGGLYTQLLLNDGYRVTVVDISREALEHNASRAEKISKAAFLTMVHDNFNKFIGKSDKTFDQFLFIKVFHHFDSLEDIFEALKKSYVRCRSGGRIIIFEPNGKNIFWKLFLKMKKDKITKKPLWHYEQNMNLTTMKNFTNFCKHNNFIYFSRYHYLIPGFILEKNISYITPLLRCLNSLLLMTPLRYLASNISCIIIKE
jgi:SAM-dependent methyltransferase